MHHISFPAIFSGESFLLVADEGVLGRRAAARPTATTSASAPKSWRPLMPLGLGLRSGSSLSLAIRPDSSSTGRLQMHAPQRGEDPVLRGDAAARVARCGHP
ncbi:MAG TPA: hypothetical protein DIC65_06880 [Actinobacteria bacterium]|nr:hypothetical protein [Actinomycetota bacterium]